jgi:hypothetical protein
MYSYTCRYEPKPNFRPKRVYEQQNEDGFFDQIELSNPYTIDDKKKAQQLIASESGAVKAATASIFTIASLLATAM